MEKFKKLEDFKREFYNKIQNNPIVAAVNDIEELELALESDCEIIFLLTGSIFNLKDIVTRVKEKEKMICIHLDLLEGFSKDLIALRYINEYIQPHGIITTRSNLIKKAKNMNMFLIQRLFILDSLSLETGITSIQTVQPDAIEILPGIMPKIIKRISKETQIPLIAGGLINDKEDVIESLKAGAIGVSSSNNSIWKL
ncbi:glycerol-3-phosphate responsive antiterminator [Alkaliphilus sp. MSJ-5]|uniref:Glycerol-3-phosphate responsive antiterminator n=1 Tax=Alkaliphilus flagellatus TaxID=2841507 RepID=A0ABS6FZ12_9FIRM|nr:glycerol-3-phosphate responsive antiterminator [Alkaliphilus flagellatus]MBU5675486.1 glycerol-3-phosphate responsive antiterminator [Alkaliphilus flagellatus]